MNQSTECFCFTGRRRLGKQGIYDWVARKSKRGWRWHFRLVLGTRLAVKIHGPTTDCAQHGWADANPPKWEDLSPTGKMKFVTIQMNLCMYCTLSTYVRTQYQVAKNVLLCTSVLRILYYLLLLSCIIDSCAVRCSRDTAIYSNYRSKLQLQPQLRKPASSYSRPPPIKQ